MSSMMTWSNADMEMVVSFLWETVYASQYELVAALVFVVGLRLGTLRSKARKPQIYKVALKPTHNPRTKGPSNQPRRPSKTSSEMKPQAFDGHIEDVSIDLLKDPSWLVPQVAHLCRSQVPKGLELYRAAVQAGLNIQQLPAEMCRSLFTHMVTGAIRGNQSDEVKKLLGDLLRSGIGVQTSLLVSAVKLCTSRQMYKDCLGIYDFISKDPSFALTDSTVWSCLLFCATEERAQQKCAFFFESLKECGTPQHKDFGNMLRLAALKGDWQTSLSLIEDMAKSNVVIDSVQYNTTLATCVVAGRTAEAQTLLDTMELLGGVADVITYNTIMKGYAKAGHMDECFMLFERLQTKGLVPSQITYGILLDGCINENQVDRAVQIFSDMNKNGVPLNTVLYTLLIKGFARAGDCEQAMNVYSKMQAERYISPDLITFSILIKANCDNNRLEEALILVGDMMTSGLKPDEVVFNNLIAGCTNWGNAKLGKQLFADMIASGVRPSNATFSILIRLYHQSKDLEEAVTMLKTEPAKHNVEPELRLYLQLVQACIRERQGRRAIEVYGLLAARSAPTQATHSSVLSTCLKLHMYDTAAEIIQIATANGYSLSARDTSLVLEGAFRKGKTQIVRSCVASMQTLGHPVDSRFLA